MDRFTKKLGPLPVWVWGLLIGGLVVVWQWTRSRGTTISGSTDEGSEDDGVTPIYPESSNVGASGNNNSGDTDNTSGDVSNTNAYWLAQGTAYLVQRGHTGRASAAALQRYLDGSTLSATEAKLVDVVVAKLGVPPEGTYGISSVTKPKPPATPTPKPKPTPQSPETTVTHTSTVLAPKNRSAVAKFVVKFVKPQGTNTVLDSGSVVVSHNGVKARGGVSGGVALVKLTDKMLPPKGSTYRYAATYDATAKGVSDSHTVFTITGK